MKLISYRSRRAFSGEPGRSDRLGVLCGDTVVPTATLGDNLPGTMGELLGGLPGSLDRLAPIVASGAVDAYLDSEGMSLDSVELLAPVARPGKIVAVGLNYRSHAQEQDRQPPESPVIFAKYATAVVAHGADITWDDRLSQAVDYEAELAVVIGRTARRVDEATPSTTSSATPASTTSARATCSTPTSSSPGRSRSTLSARWDRRWSRPTKSAIRRRWRSAAW